MALSQTFSGDFSEQVSERSPSCDYFLNARITRWKTISSKNCRFRSSLCPMILLKEKLVGF